MPRLLTLTLILLSFQSFGQLQKHQWLIGGNGQFSSSKSKELTYVSMNVSPNAGYFLADKFAIGLRPGFVSNTRKWTDDKFRTSAISVGPFARYYFLQKDNKLNLFADGAFYYSWIKSRHFEPASSYKSSNYAFSIMAGPAFFLNERTAVELTVGYSYLKKGPIDTTITNRIQLGIGFQIHIGK